MTSAPTESFVSIGGVTVRIACDDPRLATPADGSLDAFLVPPRQPDVDIRARWTTAIDDRRGSVVFDSGATWRLLQSDDKLLFIFQSTTGGAAPYRSARFNQRFTEGEVQISSRHFETVAAASVYALQYPLDELLMIHQLAQGKGVEIHGCAVRDRDGRVFLFAGQSGAGKSTLARLWLNRPDVTLLSDERVVLRTDSNRVDAYGTPWHGDARLTSPQHGPLAAIFFLHHGPAHRVASCATPLSAAKLFSCAFLPFHDIDAVDRTMTALARVTGEVPCHDLWFAPDLSVLDAIAPCMR